MFQYALSGSWRVSRGMSCRIRRLQVFKNIQWVLIGASGNLRPIYGNLKDASDVFRKFQGVFRGLSMTLHEVSRCSMGSHGISWDLRGS